MDQQPRRWRFRISTLMLLVVIVGLTVALAREQRRRQIAEEMSRANLARAEALVDQARAAADMARQAEQQARREADLARKGNEAEKAAGADR